HHRGTLAENDAVRPELELDVSLFRERRVEQGAELLPELGEIHWPWGGKTAPPGVGEHLFGEARRAAASRVNRLDLGAIVRILQGGEENLRPAEDGDQKIVEVVRDPAREHAETLEALAPLHLELELPALVLEALCLS